MNEVSRTPILSNRKLRISTGWFILLLMVLFFGLLLFSICQGNAAIGFHTIWTSLFQFNPALTDQAIVREIRLPRTIASALTGAFLAMSGTLMQGITRNPLGDPSIMGITSGAAFAISLSFAFAPQLSTPALMALSFAGACGGAALVFSIGMLSKRGLTAVKLALAGAAVSALLTSLSTAISIRLDLAKQIEFYFAGSFSGMKWAYVYPMLVIGLIVIALLLVLGRALTVLTLGEEVAKGLGQRLMLVKCLAIVLILLMTGISVAAAGVISFVGLIVPHVTRLLFGLNYRLILPLSGLLGAMLVVAADIAARMIQPPFETPVGAITTLLGGPFFLYLARREGRR
ncbi:FecCD family ABC transporter permease [Brevibacillus fulvus]|uniref:Iron complex transport system permease protein n=1 Tax=Brevibacillus fulvus TaxID=1125967 RepID=A0A938Y0B5_9BACL|nr:iron ABC transporter permease [Brevibacillus fulvus]MBM7589701.1 iron complex transport system permease protein [Brevibacillus fulvus]